MKQPTTHEQPVPQHSDGSAAKKQEAQAIQFLNQHRNAMIAGVVVAFAIVMGLVFYLNQQSRREREATLELFNGETVEDFTAVAEKYSSTTSGGYAIYMAGEAALAEGNPDQALELLRSFVQSQPKDELVPAAQFAIGKALENKDATDEALAQYQSVVASYPQSFITPEAQLGIARCFELKGELELARQTYNTIIADYGNKLWAQQADQRLQKIGLAAAPADVTSADTESEVEPEAVEPAAAEPAAETEIAPASETESEPDTSPAETPEESTPEESTPADAPAEVEADNTEVAPEEVPSENPAPPVPQE